RGASGDLSFSRSESPAECPRRTGPPDGGPRSATRSRLAPEGATSGTSLARCPAVTGASPARSRGGDRVEMVKALSEKLKAVAGACAAIEKQFGKGAVMKLGEEASEQKISVIPSGSVGLDRAFGVGGYPRGRVVEIFGQESSGKTTLTLHAIAQAQAHGG